MAQIMNSLLQNSGLEMENVGETTRPFMISNIDKYTKKSVYGLWDILFHYNKNRSVYIKNYFKSYF